MSERRKFRRYLPTGEMVMKYQIIGTGIWVYNAWRPAHENDIGSTICWEEGGEFLRRNQAAVKKFEGSPNLRQWVKIGTDPDASFYADLKVGSPERSEAVQRAYNRRYEEAYRLIFQAFPELKAILHTNEVDKIHIGGGEVEVYSL